MTPQQYDADRIAPVVLTAYNRPWHLEQTLRALQANDLAGESTLYVYCDGPKPFASDDELARISEVRRLAKAERWCGAVEVIESPYNMGLVNSFVKAITEVVRRHGKVIVLEDDQITSPGFLKYMNDALTLYEHDEEVMHVNAYMYPATFKAPQSTFFLKIQSTPGWGTWKRAWKHYNHDAEDHYRYFSRSRKLRRKFDIEGHAYFFRQLEKNVYEPNYSFAVRWYASCLRAGGLSLFPAKSLVKNIGLDGSGMHCNGPTAKMYEVETVDYLSVERIPLEEDLSIRRAVDEYYRQHLQEPFAKRVKSAQAVVKNTVWVRGFRRLLRWALAKVYPELRELEGNGLKSALGVSVVKSTVSSYARLSAPSRVRESIIGDYTYVSKNASICLTRIGKFCSIGPNFVCGWGVHPLDGISTSPMFYSTAKQNGFSLCNYNKVPERRPIRIGNDVFIGMNVTVLDGVTIGDGAVIGAGTVVSKDVPPYAIVVGNPMRILRYRFPEDTRKKLQEIAWWDWPPEKLREIEKQFFDVGGFISKHDT